MASGWAGDGAVQDQIDSTIDDAVARARRELPRGESNKFCDECGEPIPEARRQAIPGVRYCVKCQQEKDLHNNTFSGYNRRGSRIASYADFSFTDYDSLSHYLFAHIFCGKSRNMCP